MTQKYSRLGSDIETLERRLSTALLLPLTWWWWKLGWLHGTVIVENCFLPSLLKVVFFGTGIDLFRSQFCRGRAFCKPSFTVCSWTSCLSNSLPPGWCSHIWNLLWGTPVCWWPGPYRSIFQDMVYQYAQRWRYQLNSAKSVVTALTRRVCHFYRVAALAEGVETGLGGSILGEIDEQHHFGIFHSVSSSSSSQTNERASAGRSAFFALNSVGFRLSSSSHFS